MTQNTILLIDEVDAHLHPQWRSKIAIRLKEMLRRYHGLSIFLASHADEIIDSLSIEVSEPGIRKSGLLLESAEEEDRAVEIQRQVEFLQSSDER
jgi:predicted ATPase